jgi:hypothetical protein
MAEGGQEVSAVGKHVVRDERNSQHEGPRFDVTIAPQD